MRTMRRILVAVKPTDARTPALLAKTARAAKAFGAEVELFHALATPLYADTRYLVGDRLHQIEEQMRKRSLASLEKLAATLREQRIAVSVRADWDFPAFEAIVRRAKRIKADLIMVEQHAGRHLAPRLLQLTDWELLRTSPIPVLIVKNAKPYDRPVILAAIDPGHSYAKPSGLDAEILRAGQLFSRSLSGSLHAVHAVMPVPPTPVPPEIVNAKIFAELARQVTSKATRQFERELQKAGIARARRHLLSAVPSDAIEQTAQRLDSAIVVMGSVSRSGIKRLFIGNTAERVIDHLSCDVLVIKPRKFSSEVGRRSRGARLTMTPIPPFAY